MNSWKKVVMGLGLLVVPLLGLVGYSAAQACDCADCDCAKPCPCNAK